MKSRLLFKDRTFVPVPVDDRLRTDLELGYIIDHMSENDSFLKETASYLFAYENLCRSPEEIRYRQDILSDCMKYPEEVRNLYKLVASCVGMDRDTHLSITHKKAKFMLDVCVKVMISMQEPLKELYKTALHMDSLCDSEGFRNLFRLLVMLFDPDKLAQMKGFMEAVSTKDGISVVAVFGKYLRADSYHLCSGAEAPKKGVLRFLRKEKNTVEFDVDMADQDASPALARLKDEMAEPAASVVVRARDELFDFLKEMKRELAFYIGCLNLISHIDRIGLTASFPEIVENREKEMEESSGPSGRPGRINESEGFLCITELYNLSLSLLKQTPSVSNSIDCPDEKMLVITGSNQGGKTTFLRSLGQAVLMMDSGMYTAAASFKGRPGRVFTHFIREEDKTLKSGKLDEELLRMSEITDMIRPGDWLLLNESFASTNEEEGSEIAMEIITAMYDQGVRIAYVTHFYHLVKLLLDQRSGSVLYLNAEREDSGLRTYRLEPGKPLVRGYGEDLYHEIFSGSEG